MPRPIRKVVVAGATGNTGPILIKTLSAAGFQVTALTRSTAKAKAILHPDVKIVEVDYLSHNSLVSALRGSDAVVVCGIGIFGSDLTFPARRALNINWDKAAIDEYLRKHETSISHTTINTGPLLDFCLSKGVLINMKDRSISRYDSGDKRFRTTTIATASAAVATILKMGHYSTSGSFSVQDIVTTQNQLLNLAKEILPDVEWIVNAASTQELASKANEAFRTDPNSRLGSIFQKAVSIFSPEYPSDFGEADNAELGIRMMDETQLKEVLKTFV